MPPTPGGYLAAGQLSTPISLSEYLMIRVVELRTTTGQSTEHVIEFDNGSRESLLLAKAGSASKGHKFWLLEEVIQARTSPSRSQC